MTDKEKLDKCVAFIQRISDMPEIELADYDNDSVDIEWQTRENAIAINNFITDAWHILADIA